MRKLTQKPPFTRMFRMVFAHKDKAKAQDACHLTEKAIKCIVDMYEKDVILFLAREAPIEKIDGVYRYQDVYKRQRWFRSQYRRLPPAFGISSAQT